MAQRVIQTSSNLVKYDNPMVVSKHGEKRPPTAGAGKSPHTTTLPVVVPPTPGRSKLAPMSSEAKRETEEILNNILPPKEWEEDGQLWRQEVSSTPATRLDVINLQEQLDMALQQRQARETGICPVRRELYSQCFDELIRQVTINCAERGILLLRVRDEIRMTISTYQTLYESAIAFGIRKALMAEESKGDMELTIDTLAGEKKDLQKEIVELKAKIDYIERRAKEKQQAEEAKHSDELEFYKKTNQQLKAQLEGIVAPKK
ncbi:33 kDa inner dynein arm light chain, axonemal [Anabrus simplex]|uniref:33 kDa inner dynein arm light chain, axonemal n=1 Tax=Anabrus simplex TaxID=316456 RepID=UPI0034DD939A